MEFYDSLRMRNHEIRTSIQDNDRLDLLPFIVKQQIEICQLFLSIGAIVETSMEVQEQEESSNAPKLFKVNFEEKPPILLWFTGHVQDRAFERGIGVSDVEVTTKLINASLYGKQIKPFVFCNRLDGTCVVKHESVLTYRNRSDISKQTIIKVLTCWIETKKIEIEKAINSLKEFDTRLAKAKATPPEERGDYYRLLASFQDNKPIIYDNNYDDENGKYPQFSSIDDITTTLDSSTRYFINFSQSFDLDGIAYSKEVFQNKKKQIEDTYYNILREISVRPTSNPNLNLAQLRTPIKSTRGQGFEVQVKKKKNKKKNKTLI